MKLSYIHELLRETSWYQRRFGSEFLKFLVKISANYQKEDRKLTFLERATLHNKFLWNDNSESNKVNDIIRTLRQIELERLGLPAGQLGELFLKEATKKRILSSTLLKKLEIAKSINSKIPHLICRLSPELWSYLNIDMLIENEKQMNDFYSIMNDMFKYDLIFSQKTLTILATTASTLNPVLKRLKKSFSFLTLNEWGIETLHHKLSLFQDELLWRLLDSKVKENHIREFLFCYSDIQIFTLVQVFNILEEAAQVMGLRDTSKSDDRVIIKPSLSKFERTRKHVPNLFSPPLAPSIDLSQETKRLIC